MFRSAFSSLRYSTSLSSSRSTLYRCRRPLKNRWFSSSSSQGVPGGGLSQQRKGAAQFKASLNPSGQQKNSHRLIGWWLLGCAGLVFGMVGIGGITRLTRSGLSMTDWRFTGGLPPIGEQEWIKEFEKYQKFPEFKRVNRDMSLQEFKSIYFWEYAHRMYGRCIGLIFVIPLLYFIFTGRITNNKQSGYLGYKLASLGLLGGSQGLIGWWMVRSGLEDSGNGTLNDLPRVSPYRLATHLGFAFTLYSMLLYFGMQSLCKHNLTTSLRRSGIVPVAPYPAPLGFHLANVSLFGVCFMTAMMGAFVAGNDAGLVYSEWPLMGKGLIPSDLICDESLLSPKWRNLFENSSCVQFTHRMLAYSTVAIAMFLMSYSKRLRMAGLISSHCVFSAKYTASLALGQACLGIYTLIHHCPIEAASAHQCGSMAVLTAALYCAFLSRRGGYVGSAELYSRMVTHHNVRYLV